MKCLAVAFEKYPVITFFELAMRFIIRHGNAISKKPAQNYRDIVALNILFVAFLSLVLLWCMSVFCVPICLFLFGLCGKYSCCLILGIYYVLVGLPMSFYEGEPF